MGNSYFHFRQFSICQSDCAMKVGTDGVLLGAWAGVPVEAGSRQRILDIGTGTGLIALIMAQRFADAFVTGIDIDEQAVAQAAGNAAASPFAQRIEMRHIDAAKMDDDVAFDAIVCNPPFFSHSLHSPDARRSLARHDDTLTARILMQCGLRLLADGGELSVVVPAEQASQMESEALLAGFFKSRHCLVRTAAHKPVRRCLLAFRRHPFPLERTELTIGDETYTQLTKELYL
ncbi:MAG: methyltransferase [Prevotella sp.]|nr:methyltransferase [Prevotella sp.]